MNATGNATDNATGLIPAPRLVRELQFGALYPVDSETVLGAGPGTEAAARWLSAAVGAATGLPLPLGEGHDFFLSISPDVERKLGPEGYRIVVDGYAIRIEGGGPAGVFWGAQTFRQLLGPDAFRRAPIAPRETWWVPCVLIEDAPRFGWRGLMLDVARHFMPKGDVLAYLDLLAAHKLNVLHLHLTDDQGWRIEIRRYPRLTEVGAWRERTKFGHRASPLWDERPHGGYYTQDDIREIVAYAAERHITVVPEIDIPGHSQAAIAAYPELGNTDAVDT
ncbi:beta-N-acetylhexosaminidase, partial [Streptomyces sp. MCAF7]